MMLIRGFIIGTVVLVTWAGHAPAQDSAAGEAEAEKARIATIDQVKSCLGAGWAEAAERSSRNYVVLHNAARPVAITLSTDQTDSKKHLVRLTAFVRRN